jgi:hypothetical protein
MNLDDALPINWTDVLVFLLLTAVVAAGVAVFYLRSRAQELKQERIPQAKEKLRTTSELISRIRSMESTSSKQVKNQREKLQSLETVLSSYLKEAGASDPASSISPTLLRSRQLEGSPYRRGGIRFTIEGLPVPYLVRTLHMLETRLPALKTQKIQLNRLAPNRNGADVIEQGSVTLVYFLPQETE